MDARTLTKEELHRALPNGAKRVRVLDVAGAERWRKIDEIAPDDKVLFNKKGKMRVMLREPGRKKDPVAATPMVSEEVEAMVKAKYKGMDEDALTTVVGRDPESIDVLHEVMRGFAREAASLKFERKKAEAKGDDTRQISVSRIQALKAVGDTYLKRAEQLNAKGVNMSSPEFKLLFTFIVRTFRETMVQAGLRREAIDKIFSLLSGRLDDDTWEDEARRAMRGDQRPEIVEH